MPVKNKTNINEKPSLLNEVQAKPPIPSNRSKQNEWLTKQFKLVHDKHVRAVPGKTRGYYTGLINDMHKDYVNFTEKGTFLQMKYLKPVIQQTKQTSQLIDRFNEETRLEERKLEKFKAPITFSASSIQCTLPSDYRQLENLSSLSFLNRYTKPIANRQQIILKLIRKSQRDIVIELEDAKDIICEYFNYNKTYDDIHKLFDFLDINSLDSLQASEIVVICCYAERYFLHQLSQYETIFSQRPLQEVIDFEFLKRKLHGIKLGDSLQRLLTTLQEPTTRKL
ncbi:unnamed protein product [Adineta ricciae]|uniref:Uncharacterized protein n=1 Tax=Adineta ricciae TaxID=249248 RepID=A0A815LUV1_ADIRI|nr:unnamed protein product [Adineta ricciae]